MTRMGSLLCGHCSNYHRSAVPCDCEGARAERLAPYLRAVERITHRLTHDELREVLSEATVLLGPSAFWRHRASGTVFVRVGVTLREFDLVPLVRYYAHGTTGVEFCRPIAEFLDRFERTEPPRILADIHGR